MPRDGGAGLLVAAMVLIVCASNLLVTRVSESERGGEKGQTRTRSSTWKLGLSTFTL